MPNHLLMTNKLTGSIILCGMMGSGKTTVGKILADKLELPFIDLDEVIAKKSQTSNPGNIPYWRRAHIQKI